MYIWHKNSIYYYSNPLQLRHNFAHRYVYELYYVLFKFNHLDSTSTLVNPRIYYNNK